MPLVSRMQSPLFSLPYYTSAASSKASSPHSTTYCFSFQFSVFFRFLKVISICLRLLPRVAITFNLPSISYCITYFRRQFPHKMWPIQFSFLLFTVCRIFLSSLTLRNTSSSLKRSVQPTFSIPLQHHIRIYCVFWNMSCLWTKPI